MPVFLCHWGIHFFLYGKNEKDLKNWKRKSLKHVLTFFMLFRGSFLFFYYFVDSSPVAHWSDLSSNLFWLVTFSIGFVSRNTFGKEKGSQEKKIYNYLHGTTNHIRSFPVFLSVSICVGEKFITHFFFGGTAARNGKMKKIDDFHIIYNGESSLGVDISMDLLFSHRSCKTVEKA